MSTTVPVRDRRALAVGAGLYGLAPSGGSKSFLLLRCNMSGCFGSARTHVRVGLYGLIRTGSADSTGCHMSGCFGSARTRVSGLDSADSADRATHIL